MKKYKLKFSHTSYNILNSDSNEKKKIYVKKNTTYNEPIIDKMSGSYIYLYTYGSRTLISTGEAFKK